MYSSTVKLYTTRNYYKTTVNTRKTTTLKSCFTNVLQLLRFTFTFEDH